MIQIENAGYRYPTGNAGLEGVSLSINPGERVCLLGGNGSGKSTLLRLVAGILKPTAGSMLINGRAAEANPMTGFIFQNPEDQIVAGSVEQELAFALENFSTKRVEMQDRVCAIAARFGLQSLFHRHPLSLSAGEKQRLALAATMITTPELLLLDEPTSFLDRPGRKLLSDTLTAFREVTIIAATQYLDEIGQFKRIVFLERGRITFDGTVDQFKESQIYPERAEPAAKQGRAHEQWLPASTRSGLKVDHVSFSYPDGMAVLEDATSEFFPAQITAILGDSGSGKTTLAKILCGQERAGSGDVRLRGEYERPQRLLDHVALVMQFPEDALFAETVFEEVAFGLRNAGTSPDAIGKGVEQSLRLVGLGLNEYRDRNPLHLSAGEKRRVAIASMLVLNRPIVIFDEMTAGLDWEGVAAMAGLLRLLKQRGSTVIVISHDERFIQQVADRTLLLTGGKLQDYLSH